MKSRKLKKQYNIWVEGLLNPLKEDGFNVKELKVNENIHDYGQIKNLRNPKLEKVFIVKGIDDLAISIFNTDGYGTIFSVFPYFNGKLFFNREAYRFYDFDDFYDFIFSYKDYIRCGGIDRYNPNEEHYFEEDYSQLMYIIDDEKESEKKRNKEKIEVYSNLNKVMNSILQNNHNLVAIRRLSEYTINSVNYKWSIDFFDKNNLEEPIDYAFEDFKKSIEENFNYKNVDIVNLKSKFTRYIDAKLGYGWEIISHNKRKSLNKKEVKNLTNNLDSIVKLEVNNIEK